MNISSEHKTQSKSNPMIVYESFFRCAEGTYRANANKSHVQFKSKRDFVYVQFGDGKRVRRMCEWVNKKGNRQHSPNSILSASQYLILCGFIYLFWLLQRSRKGKCQTKCMCDVWEMMLHIEAADRTKMS